MTAPAMTCMRARCRQHRWWKPNNGGKRRAQHLSPSSRARRPATQHSTRLMLRTHSNTLLPHSRTSIDCSLASPRQRWPRNHLSSPNRRAPKGISLHATQRCAPLAASPTTPGHLPRPRRPRRILAPGQHRLTTCIAHIRATPHAASGRAAPRAHARR